MSLTSVALDEARSLLNDVSGTLFTDSVLMPFVKKAHRELQLELDLKQLSILKEISAILTIPANNTSIPVPPTDIIRPIKIEERPTGSTESFIPMDETEWEVDLNPIERLRFWTWREESVRFPGATQSVDIQLFYLKGLTIPVDGTSQLGMERVETFIAARSAAIAAFVIMQDEVRAGVLNADAAAALDKILRTTLRDRQNIGSRRLPFMRRYSNQRLFRS